MTLKDLPDHHDMAHLKGALKFVKNWRTAIDGGAHRGIFTTVLCDRFDTVHAFEPTDLCQKIDPRAIVCQSALGALQGCCSMQSGAENTGQTHVTLGEGTEIARLDQFDIADVDFIKLDVEGYEWFALLGAMRTILRDRPVVMIEENGLCQRYGVAPFAANRLMEEWGARCVARYNKDYVFAWA
ncbi:MULTISPECIES: FkbM family methyltransferase [Thalassospira]|uniref:FkbM family methyltransferase n=1 Tax=Thalassospira TaxID=168934 RepID=UPI0008DE453F|nr:MULTISPECIES: FkbM family methyltransferase [Thalassospira]MDM7975230.1 FkbM family methyltransferase [Thalassospira xiamenensis]OHZ00987.1 hypothetical protein BC440_09105 [Thalassospira sp. MIT1004]